MYTAAVRGVGGGLRDNEGRNPKRASRLRLALQAAASILVGFTALAASPTQAKAVSPTVPMRETACLAGMPWAELGYSGCELSTPSPYDVGRPIVTLVGPGERFIYVVEQAYNVLYGGGEHAAAPDTIVQLALDGNGQPSFVSCLSTVATPDCKRLPESAMFEAQSAVLAPDGQNLYVASESGISSFAIEPSGGLRFTECVGVEGGACVRPTWSLDQEATVQIAIAPDSRDLYAVTEGRLRDFHLGTSGAVSLAHCYDFRSACPEELPRGEWGSVAVSPDGQTVLEVLGEDSINAYHRLPDGSLLFTGCLAAAGVECPSVGANERAMDWLGSVLIAPNGRDVYVLGSSRGGDIAPSTLTHLRLTSSGTLEFAGCLQTDAPACEQLPSEAPDFQEGEFLRGGEMAITPNGDRLIITAGHIDVFRLDKDTGTPSYEACSGAEIPCELGQTDEGRSVQVAPNGDSVWVSGEAGGRTTRLQLDAAALATEGPLPQPQGVTIRNLKDNGAEANTEVMTGGAKTRYAFEVEKPGGARSDVEGRREGREEADVHVVGDLELQPSTSYRVRAVASNSGGEAAGPWTSFTTESCAPAGLGEVATQNYNPEIATTATTLIARGAISPGCLPTGMSLEYGLTERYEHKVTLSPSEFPVTYSLSPFYLEATGLTPGARYYYRLTASNRRGEVVLKGDSATLPTGSPTAVEVAADTGTARPGESDATAVLEGVARIGDTPAEVTAQVFRHPEADEPPKQVSLGELSPDREPQVVNIPVSGLECGVLYHWRLVVTAAYGHSLGATEPLLTPCSLAPPGEESTPSPESPLPSENPVVSGPAPPNGAATTTVLPGEPTSLMSAPAPAPNFTGGAPAKVAFLSLRRGRGSMRVLRLRLSAPATKRMTITLEMIEPRGADRRTATLSAVDVTAGPAEQVDLPVDLRTVSRLHRAHPTWAIELFMRRESAETSFLRLPAGLARRLEVSVTR
jgi:hypothetical protein